jgi:hypothetical protein
MRLKFLPVLFVPSVLEVREVREVREVHFIFAWQESLRQKIETARGYTSFTIDYMEWIYGISS